MNLKQYNKQLKIAENFAEQNDWLAVRNTLCKWFIEMQKNPKLIDEKGLLILLETALQIKDKLGENELSKGILIYEYITKLQPKKALLWHNLGMLYLSKGDIDKSYNAHKKSISLPNFDSEYYLYLYQLLSFKSIKDNDFLSLRQILLKKCRCDNNSNENLELNRLGFPYLLLTTKR